MRNFISVLSYSSIQDFVGSKPMFTLECLSVSVVKEDGSSITLLSKEFNPSQVEAKYLQTIVDSGTFAVPHKEESLIQSVNLLQNGVGVSRFRMNKMLREFIGMGGFLFRHDQEEDFFILKSILGNLDGFFRVDLKQEEDRISASVNDDYALIEDSMYPIPSWQGFNRVPSSLERAKWCRDLYLFMEEFKSRQK